MGSRGNTDGGLVLPGYPPGTRVPVVIKREGQKKRDRPHGIALVLVLL